MLHKRIYFSGIVPYMELPIEKLLAENIGRIFEVRGITSAVRAAAELKVPKSTIDRAWHNRSMARLDTLNDVAIGLKLQPWQLLVPGLDPACLPTLAGAANDTVIRRSTQQKTLPMRAAAASRDEVSAEAILELIGLYQQSTDRGRQKILDVAQVAAKGGSKD